MAGTLFVVATPIGNLEDITFRAVRVLREVGVVAAEDTRRTGQLLRHFGIPTRLVSLHRHNESLRSEAVVSRLRGGTSVALVTDAGTPGISDPGARLVAAAVAAGLRVEPVPGCSALTTALSVAGLEADVASFMGFPPVRGKPRNEWFDRLDLLAGEGVVAFFEAPHRMRTALEELHKRSYSQIVVLRELTKLHESAYRGAPYEILVQLGEPVGEFVIVVPQVRREQASVATVDEAAVIDKFGQITGTKTREAARIVARSMGISPNRVYEIVSRRKD
ncbi:MAG: 16S rRNA (cytidine(1402)-2'-O)-methyltransferase [Vicinamibacterales bacterium]